GDGDHGGGEVVEHRPGSIEGGFLALLHLGGALVVGVRNRRGRGRRGRFRRGGVPGGLGAGRPGDLGGGAVLGSLRRAALALGRLLAVALGGLLALALRRGLAGRRLARLERRQRLPGRVLLGRALGAALPGGD